MGFKIDFYWVDIVIINQETVILDLSVFLVGLMKASLYSYYHLEQLYSLYRSHHPEGYFDDTKY